MAIEPLVRAEASLAVARAFDVDLEAVTPEGASATSPDEVVGWLARLRVLHGVPFAYLAAHDEMVPNEAIRFFHVDRNWLDAAVDGALSVAAVTARDRELLAALLAELRDEVDAAERRVRPVEDTATQAVDGTVGAGAGSPLTGFVLRSLAVSGWPGMEVHATTAGQRLRFLRLERLAPGVLLAVIDGVPDRVELVEPRSGIQFGVDLTADGTGAVLPLRDPRTGRKLPITDPDDDQHGADAVFNPQVVPPAQRDGTNLRVPFRTGGHGAIHVQELVRRLRGIAFDGRALVAAHGQPDDDDPATPPSGPASDDLAVQLLQFPFLQPFEGEGGATGPGGGLAGFVRSDLDVHLDRVFLTR